MSSSSLLPSKLVLADVLFLGIVDVESAVTMLVDSASAFSVKVLSLDDGGLFNASGMSMIGVTTRGKDCKYVPNNLRKSSSFCKSQFNGMKQKAVKFEMICQAQTKSKLNVF